MKAFIVNSAAGTIGGVAYALVRRPLDKIDSNVKSSAPKTAVDSNRAAGSSPGAHRGRAIADAMNAVRRQGLRGIYAEIGPALASECVKKSMTFGAYGQCQKIVAGGDAAGLNFLESATAGSISSMFTSIICPTENIRNTGSNQIGQVNKNKWKTDSLQRYTIVRDNIRNFFLFGSYEWARDQLKPVGKQKEDCTALATLTAGAFAGCLKSFVIHPVDVIKSRVHMSGKPCGLHLVWEEICKAGLHILCKNLWSHLMKSVPTTAVMMFSVEFSRPFFRRCLSEIETMSFDQPFLKLFSFRDFVSGWTAGIVSTFLGHPMGPVKVIKQVINAMTTKQKTALDIHSQEKSAGYFRGMVIPILSVGVTYAIFFGMYRNTQRLIQIYRNEDEKKDNVDVGFYCDSKNKFWHLDVFVSGCVAGFFYSVANIPIEAVKTMIKQSSSIMTDKPQPENIISPIKWIGDMYKKNGLHLLYRGGTLLMIRNLPYMGLYVLTYENLCCVIKKLWYSQNYEEIENEPVPRFIKTISGGVAGVTIGLLVLPFDVVVAKMLEDSLNAKPQYKDVWDCVKQTYRKSGSAKEIFRGFRLLCVRNFIVSGIMFVAYEKLMNSRV